MNKYIRYSVLNPDLVHEVKCLCSGNIMWKGESSRDVSIIKLEIRGVKMCQIGFV